MDVRVDDSDVVRMRGQLFFDGDDARRKLSRFWMLLLLAGVIASAGVIGDSTATVIGAMIVAPLMTPILGIVLAVVCGDRPNLVKSLLLVAGGALAVIVIGYLMGLFIGYDVVAATNGQVAARVTPRLIDLVAALATGAVGAVALNRSDISDTLPGVAIAISLVPPLAVVGLTAESGAPHQAYGALVLFLTNVCAILASGVAVMWFYGVHRVATDKASSSIRRSRAVVIIGALLVVIIVPLAFNSKRVDRTVQQEQVVRSDAKAWATSSGWTVLSSATHDGVVFLALTGPAPQPRLVLLSELLVRDGISPSEVRVVLLPNNFHTLPSATPARD